MWEVFGRLIAGLLPSAIKSLTDRTKLRIVCGWTNQPNEDGVGNYLAMWIKIINPTSLPLYFERLVTVDQDGEVFYPSFYRVKAGDEIPPRKNIVGLIPRGHVTQVKPKELHVYDGMERKHTVKGRVLRKVVDGLATERIRLEKLNIGVHPSRPHPV